MTQNKELVFNDLSARIPHHVRVKVWLKDGTTEEGFLDIEHNYGDVLRDAFYYHTIKEIKAYLRPLSSITEEEEKELNQLLKEVYDFTFRVEELLEEIFTQKFIPYKFIDWLNKHHFDYRGLIEMGLAIEVTEDNNPYKEKK